MKRIVIATRNKNKKREIKELLKGLKAEILSLADINAAMPTVIEDGKTFRQNAIKKALTISRYVKGIVLADDSGLMVRALGGKPGVRSARFAHVKASDAENNAKLLKLMKNVPAKDRQAAFVSSAAIAEDGVLIGTAEGRVNGTIGFEPRGENGFGYDPLFTPKGKTSTFAEFKPEFKNKISHRGKAIRVARALIQEYL